MTRVAVTVDVEHADTDNERVAPILAEVLLTALELELPLTLFVQGRWARNHPGDLSSHLASDSLFTWATHGYWHAPWPALTAHGLRADLMEGDEALDETLNPNARRAPTLVRAPYGDLNRRSRLVARVLGYVVVGWDVHFADWERELNGAYGPTGHQGLANQDSIILLHHWTNHVLVLLRSIADVARDNDVELVGLEPSMLRRRIATGMTIPAVLSPRDPN